jgi:cytochrome c1
MLPEVNYEEAVAAHEWRVPDHYNIAEDVCDKHPGDKLAMIHEHFDGTVREVLWGELQQQSNRFANVLRAHGVQKGDRVAMLLPPTPETAAAFFGTWKAGAILLSMSVLYGDDGIRHRVSDSQAKVLLTNAANKDRVDPALVDHVLLLDDALLAQGDAARGADLVHNKIGGGCIGCHAISGTNFASTVGPNLTHVGSRNTIAAGLFPNDAKHLALWIKNARRMKPGVIMPTIGADQVDPVLKKKPTGMAALTDAQIADVVAYLRSLK